MQRYLRLRGPLLPESAQRTKRFHVDAQVPFRVGAHPRGREREQSATGSRPARVRGVVGVLSLLLKMDEGSGQLDECLIETPVRIGAPEPEMLEDVVGLVILGLIKAEEKRPVLSGKLQMLGFFVGKGFLGGVPGIQPGFKEVVFFHSHQSGKQLILG